MVDRMVGTGGEGSGGYQRRDVNMLAVPQGVRGARGVACRRTCVSCGSLAAALAMIDHITGLGSLSAESPIKMRA